MHLCLLSFRAEGYSKLEVLEGPALRSWLLLVLLWWSPAFLRMPPAGAPFVKEGAAAAIALEAPGGPLYPCPLPPDFVDNPACWLELILESFFFSSCIFICISAFLLNCTSLKSYMPPMTDLFRGWPLPSNCTLRPLLMMGFSCSPAGGLGLTYSSSVL